MSHLEDKLFEELKNCSIEELWLIYDTQKDLYSEEELSVIRHMAKQKKLHEDSDQEQRLRLFSPRMTACEKCGTVNGTDAKRCVNCGCKLKEKKAVTKLEMMFILLYIFSFLIPPAGMIIGISLISYGETERHFAGKKCFEISLTSAVLTVLVLFLYLFWKN